MIQTTVEVGGMACSMCEAHINDAIRNAFPVEKVSSSHSKGRTVILSKEPLDENALRAAIQRRRDPGLLFLCGLSVQAAAQWQFPAQPPLSVWQAWEPQEWPSAWSWWVQRASGSKARVPAR